MFLLTISEIVFIVAFQLGESKTRYTPNIHYLELVFERCGYKVLTPWKVNWEICIPKNVRNSVKIFVNQTFAINVSVYTYTVKCVTHISSQNSSVDMKPSKSYLYSDSQFKRKENTLFMSEKKTKNSVV